jgi:hypothetical protein
MEHWVRRMECNGVVNYGCWELNCLDRMLGIEGWTGWIGEFLNCLDRMPGIEGWAGWFGEFQNCLDRMLGIEGWTGWIGVGLGIDCQLLSTIYRIFTVWLVQADGLWV